MKSSYWSFAPIKVSIDHDGVLHLDSVDFEFETNKPITGIFDSRDMARDYLIAAVNHYEN